MRTLRLVALADDGTHLVLVAEDPGSPDGGERFELPLDDRLRAAARGDAHRIHKLENEQGNALPPRVIQARIRAGETPEQVAHASGTSVERIMRFAHPVLQERARIAEQARDARVRLTDSAASVPLEKFMAERLRLLGADLDAVRWDAHRTENGTWQVRASWRAGHKSGTTRWTYDIPAKTVTPVDATTLDFAEGTRLVRVVPNVPAGVPAPGPRSRPVAARRDPAPPTRGEPTGEDTGAPEKDDEDDDPRSAPGHRSPVDILLSGNDGAAAADTVVLGKLTEAGLAEAAPAEGKTDDPRVRIPAWEDIVFGVRRHR